ncbi:ABC transporter substrate-binding protein [Bombiscardovia nodaiensis]|uniref:ABC transporter substrate-binding protein n=1 Tax=Bombiscardovia nodaiensis TaxID=2932181 RepID=A0ABN6SCM1_9BIFI|nr:ABC transporter substrate-binding protein [Bombiscardovia nodaiensis]
MSSSNEGVSGSSGTTPAPYAGSVQPGPSTDPILNQHLKAPKQGSPLPWKILSLVLAVALVCSLWALSQAGKAASGGGQASAQPAQSMSIGLKLAPSNLDIRNQSGSALDQALVGNVYEGLVTRDESNAVQPGLAKSWQVSADGKTYTFHLNSGMKFSNGDTLDADDVAWSISELMSRKYHDAEQVRNFQAVRVLDPATVELKLSAPYASLLWVLAGRPGLVFDKDAKYDPKSQAIGSGPYTVAAFVPNDSLTLKANPSYWGPHKAKTPTIYLRYMSDDNAAVNALRSHDIQVLAPITATLAAPFKSDSAHYQVHVGQGTDKYVLAMNSKGSKTSDLRVRQAIRYAIDHGQLIASRGSTDLALGGPIPKLDPGYEDLTGLYPRNERKAQELMSAAGYSPARPLQLRLTYANTYGTELGDQLRSQLKPIGIDLQVQVVEFSTWMQNVYTNHDYDLSLVDHSESHDFAQWTNPSYYYGYDSPKVRELYQQAMAASSSQESNKLLAQAARQVSQDAPADWLLNYQISTAMLVGVHNFPLSLNQTLLPLSRVYYTPDNAGTSSSSQSASAGPAASASVSRSDSGASAEPARLSGQRK